MAKTIEVLRSGLTVGHVGLGVHGAGVGSVRQQVPDGDTIIIRALGNFGVRFLGVDAPEVFFPLPSAPSSFVNLNDPRREVFLANPFADEWGPSRIRSRTPSSSSP